MPPISTGTPFTAKRGRDGVRHLGRRRPRLKLKPFTVTAMFGTVFLPAFRTVIRSVGAPGQLLPRREAGVDDLHGELALDLVRVLAFAAATARQ